MPNWLAIFNLHHSMNKQFFEMEFKSTSIQKNQLAGRDVTPP
jgi:hypothetical protein